MRNKLYENLDSSYITEQYEEYLSGHIRNIMQGFEWLYMYLPDIFNDVDIPSLISQLKQHDASKYSEEEYMPYAMHFYGKRSEETDTQFDYAWLHHSHYNPHHWEHWVIVAKGTDNFKVLDMPYNYILEMLCDHWTFAWKSGNLYEIFTWYNKNKDDMILSKKTRTTYESLLSKLKQKLDEMKALGEL